MGKKCENKKTPKYVVASEKRKHFDGGFSESCYKWNVDTSVRDENIILSDGGKKKERKDQIVPKKRFYQVIGYIFCILGIICAWGTIDTVVDLISGNQIYKSLICYSITLFFGFMFLSIYICLFDRNYKPHETMLLS